MTIVDEAMARLRRDRPEMSPQSVEYVERLLEYVMLQTQADERERWLLKMAERQFTNWGTVRLMEEQIANMALTAPSAPAGSPVPSDP